MKGQIYLRKTRKRKCLKKQTCSLHVQEPKMFFQKCGEEVKKIDNFCGKCDEKQQQKTVTEKKEVRTLQILINILREDRADHFKPSKSSTSTSTIARKSKPLIHNVTINVGIINLLEEKNYR